MSAYCTREQALAYISAGDLRSFLDDDGDGVEDPGLLDSIISTVSGLVDGALAAIYAVPFSPPYPPKAQEVTLIFLCEALYKRRLTPDEKNPFKAAADEYRKQLDSIRRSGTGFDATVSRAISPGVAVQAPIVVNTTTM
jgi:hypothetical protein